MIKSYTVIQVTAGYTLLQLMIHHHKNAYTINTYMRLYMYKIIQVAAVSVWLQKYIW